jgi:hypothetical protein
MSWWVAFALTQSIEMPLYVWGTRDAELPVPWRVAIAFGASALTHPVVWFVLPGLLMPRLGYWGFFAVAETFAVVAEALYLRAFGIENPWRLALLANVASASTGLVLHALR